MSYETVLWPSIKAKNFGPKRTRTVRLIVIHDMVPPKVLPRPLHFSEDRAPPYSDAAALQDVWTRAWMVIDPLAPHLYELTPGEYSARAGQVFLERGG